MRPEAQVEKNEIMRGLASLVLVVGIMLGIYYFYFKQMPTTDPGTAPTQAINLTGVRMDLLQIAQSERTFISQNGRCGALDELISSDTLRMARTEREGYSYSISCYGTDFYRQRPPIRTRRIADPLSQFGNRSDHAGSRSQLATRATLVASDERGSSGVIKT